MLGDRRIVVVRRAERLLKPKRAGRPADDEEESPSDEAEGPVDAGPLEDYIAAPSPSTTVVFVAADVDRTRRLTKRLIEKALVTVFDGNELDSPRGDARANLANVLRGTLAREGRSIDRDAGAMLVNRAGGDVSKLRDDIERLVLFVGDRKRITEDDVMEVAADRGGSDDVWAVVNAIAAGDAATALREMAKRLDQGDSPHAVVGQLRWWVSAKLAAADAHRVKPALDAVLRTDMALKGSGLDKRVLVERLVVELTGRPIASSRWEGREGGSRRT
jgi:DNA polymerase-3 subunit delta